MDADAVLLHDAPVRVAEGMDMVCNVRVALRLDPDTGMNTIRGRDAMSIEHETLFRKTITTIAPLQVKSFYRKVYDIVRARYVINVFRQVVGHVE